MTDVRQPLLILGGSGMLGGALRRNACSPVLASYASRPFDGGICYQASAKGAFESLLDQLSFIPSAVLLLLGQSSLEFCFRDSISSRRINVDGIADAVNVAAERGIPSIFISTDVVFDGSRPLWRDTDKPRPIVEYGRQKYEAEMIVLASENNLVIRIPKLVAQDMHPQCFVTSWLRDLEVGRRINCATDQRFNPIGVDDAARAILALIERSARGIVHVATMETYSRWELLKRLLERVDFGLFPIPDIHPCTLADLSLPEPRPPDTSLSPSKIIAELAYTIRSPMSLIDRRVDDFNRSGARAKGLQ